MEMTKQPPNLIESSIDTGSENWVCVKKWAPQKICLPVAAFKPTPKRGTLRLKKPPPPPEAGSLAAHSMRLRAMTPCGDARKSLRALQKTEEQGK